MYKQCKTEQSANRQRELEQSLLAAMEHEHYDEITVSDLCERAGIPRKSFYRYFSSKDGALHALMDHTMMDFESFSGPYRPGMSRSLQRDMERYFMFWAEKKDFLRVMESSDLVGVLIQRAVDTVVMDRSIPQRFLPEDEGFTRKQILFFSVCGLMTMVFKWHQSGFVQTPQQMAQVAVRLLTSPLFPDVERFF